MSGVAAPTQDSSTSLPIIMVHSVISSSHQTTMLAHALGLDTSRMPFRLSSAHAGSLRCEAAAPVPVGFERVMDRLGWKAGEGRESRLNYVMLCYIMLCHSIVHYIIIH